jgi:outer membrane lipopolysaccharide assembly protein LptE/RlpB
MLFQDMERDATGQILRRMIAVKKDLVVRDAPYR